MKKRNIKKILPQMYDIRPTDVHGNLDLAKIGKANKVVKIKEKNFHNNTSAQSKSETADSHRIFTDIIAEESRHPNAGRKIKKSFENKKSRNIYQLGKFFVSEEVPVFHESEIPYGKFSPGEDDIYFGDERLAGRAEENIKRKDIFILQESHQYSQEEIFSFDEILLTKHFNRLRFKKTAFSFGAIAAALLLLVFGVGFIYKGMKIKGMILSAGNEAYSSLAQAKEEILNKNFEKSEFEFSNARDNFSEISKDIDSMGKFFVEVTRFIPFVSKVSSGSYLAKAGQDISQAGIVSGKILKTLSEIKSPFDQQEEAVSFLRIFQDSAKNSQELLMLVEDADKNLSKVNIDDIPEDKRSQFSELKEKLPELRRLIKGFLDNSYIFTDILGGNGPRKYLFLFQNNQEMRATGGFIGSYGAMNISNGRIKKFFIDGIFNPDGQLREKVVPPAPIQKISAAWSLHDSNWFPDFPVSAEKAAWFYEKTGGPTVDGVIAMTPTVMQKLLEITGPIEMSEYGVTVDKDNFVEKIQYEVEIDYDKELNQPKQILADLAPRILDRIFNSNNFSDISKTMNVFIESLNEKQILIYSKNYEIEKKLSEEGWSGEILEADRDYVSVIDSNINGFKTDGVIDEKIDHKSEIQEDGSIIDTLTITRRHNGGNSDFEWWNKVNADYMRVYVPRGSKLISADGQTREFNSPPLDYNALNFKRDPQVQSEEDSIEVDQASGTRVYNDANKTVFANWVYVSPQETATIIYKYSLPFKISMDGRSKPADTYSLLIQKQSGDMGDEFTSSTNFPNKFKAIWKYPDEIVRDGNSLNLKTELKTDKFIGIAFTQND